MSNTRLLTLFSSTTLVCMIYGLMTPFLPLMAEDKGLEVWQTGIVFAAHPLMGMIASLLIGSVLDKVGRRNTLLISFEMAAAGLLLSGLSNFMDKVPFFIANFVARSCTGISGSLLFIDGTNYAVIAIFASDYPEKTFRYIGINESCAGLGFLLGPLVGAGLYIALGFTDTFFVACAFYFVCGIAVFRILGPDREYKVTEKDEHILSLAVRPRIFVALFPVFFGMATMSAQGVFLSTHLKHHGLSTAWSAAAFGLTGVGFLLTCVVLAHTMETWNKKVVNAVGGFIAVVAMALAGPWPLVLPDNLLVILIGFALMPLGTSIVLVESMPLLIEVATRDLGLQLDDKLTDKLAAISTFGIVFGELVGPLYQGFVASGIGIRDTCGSFAGIGAALTLVFVAIVIICPRRSNSALLHPENYEHT